MASDAIATPMDRALLSIVVMFLMVLKEVYQLWVPLSIVGSTYLCGKPASWWAKPPANGRFFAAKWAEK
jgi:hypothetical protein